MKYEKQERFHPLANSHSILRGKTVAVVGIGGLGSHSAEYAVRMGLGNVMLIDGDIVEETNLPRQGLYAFQDSKLHRYKVEAAKERLQNINPDTNIVTYAEMLTPNNIDSLLKNVDLVLDGTDNMLTRYLINDYCFAQNIPWVYAAATASVGVVSNFIPGKTPCLRCIYGEPQEDQTTCDINGIILPALTMITSLQVTEAIKILLGHEPILGELRFDVWTRKESVFDTTILVDKSCVCKKRKQTPKSNIKTYMICSGDTIQVNTQLTKGEMKDKFEKFGYKEMTENELLVVLKKNNGQQIVGYITGKIIFHHTNKNEIETMMN